MYISVGKRLSKALWLIGGVLASACATVAERDSLAAFDRIDGAPMVSVPSTSTPPESRDFETVEALERHALVRNPEVRAAYLTWKAAIEAVPGARVWPGPMLKYAGLPLPLETRSGPQEHRFGVSQAIPWPGKLEAGADLLASKATLAAQRFEARRVAVLRDLREPMVSLASIDALRVVLSEQLVLLKQLSVAVQARQAIGKASFAQAARVALSMAKLEDRIAQLDAEGPGLQARVRAAAGLTPESKLPRLVMAPITPLGHSVAALRKRLQSHPMARTEAAAAAVERAEGRREASQRYPDFAVGVDWMPVGAPADGVMSATAGRDALMATVGIRIPLSLGAFDAKERSAQTRAMAADARRDAVIAKAEAALVGLVTRLKEATRREALYRKTLAPQAQVAFESALASYSAARGDFRDLFELTQRLLEYRFEIVLAKTRHAMTRVALEYLVGTDTQTTGGAP